MLGYTTKQGSFLPIHLNSVKGVNVKVYIQHLRIGNTLTPPTEVEVPEHSTFGQVLEKVGIIFDPLRMSLHYTAENEREILVVDTDQIVDEGDLITVIAQCYFPKT
ncbi:MAG: hypothetical protein WC289_00125 [Patescibacteria group bacterium]|jgi:hypothetical protein